MNTKDKIVAGTLAAAIAVGGTAIVASQKPAAVKLPTAAVGQVPAAQPGTFVPK